MSENLLVYPTPSSAIGEERRRVFSGFNSGDVTEYFERAASRRWMCDLDSTGELAMVTEILQRLIQIERLLNELLEQRTIKDWYSTAEAALGLGKAEFTVREWCRLGRVLAKKRACGRGLSQEWIISHAEIQRVRNEGLLPVTPSRPAQE